jgi:hypothetical protein
MWRHNHVHEFAADYLLALMAQNKMFANVKKKRFSNKREINAY